MLDSNLDSQKLICYLIQGYATNISQTFMILVQFLEPSGGADGLRSQDKCRKSNVLEDHDSILTDGGLQKLAWPILVLDAHHLKKSS
jgi:hypothetical protein